MKQGGIYEPKNDFLESQIFYLRADRERGRHELAQDNSSVPLRSPEEDECIQTSHLQGS